MSHFVKILKACPGINPSSAEDSLFLCKVQEDGLSIEQTGDAWERELVKRSRETKADILPRVLPVAQKLHSLVSSKGMQAIGTVEPRQRYQDDAGGIYADEGITFPEKVISLTRNHNITRRQAVKIVNEQYPELRQECVDVANGVSNRPYRGHF